jgi:hypothetical protein
MEAIERYAVQRCLPLALVVAGAGCRSDISITIDGDRALLRPWDEEVEVQGLSAEAAAELGALLAHPAASGEEPLVAGPAPVTDIRQRGAGDGGAGSDGGEVSGEVSGEETAAVLVRVLGDITVEGLAEPLTAQQLSLLCFLACNGPSTRSAITEALWNGQAISKSRFLNVLAETRARVGRNHIPEVRDGRYQVSGVATDLARFERAVAAAQRLEGRAAAAKLRTGLDLVAGVPFTAPESRFWSWVGDASRHSARVEAAVADSAARLARIEREVGDLEGARWACERGMLASPTDETLVVLLTEIYLEMGKSGSAHRLVDAWEEKISRMECGDPSDEPRKRLSG